MDDSIFPGETKGALSEDSVEAIESIVKELYDIVRQDIPFEDKARQVLEIGRIYLGADNGHLTRIDQETDHWEAIISTDPIGGEFPPGLELDLQSTYCRQVLNSSSQIALSDAPNQGWGDDPAFEAHELHCYLGTPLRVSGEEFGTVCFVANNPRETPFSDGEKMLAELISHMLERELEREQYESQLTRQTNLSLVLNRVLRHNLRNELAVIRGYTQMMANALTESNFGQRALQSIDKLIRLSEKARELDEIVASDEERDQSDVRETVEEVIDSVRNEYPTASISIDADEEVMAALFPSFKRALRELIENAAIHAGEQPTIDITVQSVPNAVEVRITDDGPGLGNQEIGVLSSGSETPLMHGSGLGLWLAHWIVSSHDGTIEASVTEAGTTLTITVPRTPEAEGEQRIRDLVRARDQYKAAFEEAGDAITITDDEAHILDVNQEAATFYGLDRQELLGRSMQEFVPDGFDFRSEWSEIQSADRKRDEMRIVDTNGRIRTIEYTVKTDIVPGQHLIVSRDITDLKKHNRRFEAIFNQTYQFTGLLEPDGTVVEANETALDFGGLNREDVIGKPFWEAGWWLKNDATQQEVREAVARAAKGEFVRYEVEVQGEEETAIIDFSIRPITDDRGNVTELIPEGRDITEQKQRERELERTNEFLTILFETVPAAIVVLDADGNITQTNSFAEEQTGLAESEITDRTYQDPQWAIFGEDGKPIPTEELPFSQVMKTGEAVVDFEHGITLPDGSKRWLSINAAPIRGEDGAIEKVVSVLKDDTNLRKYRQNLEAENERLEEFASTLTHDLRNPLSVAQGQLELAQEKCDSEHLEYVERAHRRMDALIEDILTLAREGKAVTERQQVDIAPLVRDCWTNVDTKNTTMDVDIDRRLWCDESRIQQLFENLFRNSVQHGGEDITVTVGELDDGFFVEDDGPGIPEANRDDVFEPGFSTSPEGTGFGLNIIREIVKAHNWEIQATESADGGARFEITGVEFVAE